MPAEENTALASRFVELIIAHQLDDWDELIVEDYRHHDPALPPEALVGRDNYKRGIAMFFNAFPDLNATLEDAFSAGDRVAARLTFRGSQHGELMGIPPTGKAVEFGMLTIHRVADGKLVEGWVNFDAFGMLQQLGAIPAPGQTG